jgi:hypothetical protein
MTNLYENEKLKNKPSKPAFLPAKSISEALLDLENILKKQIAKPLVKNNKCRYVSLFPYLINIHESNKRGNAKFRLITLVTDFSLEETEIRLIE